MPVPVLWVWNDDLVVAFLYFNFCCRCFLLAGDEFVKSWATECGEDLGAPCLMVVAGEFLCNGLENDGDGDAI
jgi:hypothetical protein